MLSLAFLCFLFVSLSDSSNAQNQTKDEKQKEATFEGMTVSEWVEILKSSNTSTTVCALFAMPQLGDFEVLEALKLASCLRSACPFHALIQRESFPYGVG